MALLCEAVIRHDPLYIVLMVIAGCESSCIRPMTAILNKDTDKQCRVGSLIGQHII